MRRSLIIFLKEPHPGRVKTRLGREIGMVEAAWWFRHQALAIIRRLAPDRRWRTVLALTPDAEGLASRIWPARLPRIAQGPGDLGARMARVLATMPPGPAIVVGADIPALTRAQIAEGFRLLGRHEAVIGPAEDGGFWMIGLKRGARAAPAGFLAGVRWSGPHALTDALATLGGLEVGWGPVLRDVDQAADLRPPLSGGRSSLPPHPSPPERG